MALQCLEEKAITDLPAITGPDALQSCAAAPRRGLTAVRWRWCTEREHRRRPVPEGSAGARFRSSGLKAWHGMVGAAITSQNEPDAASTPRMPPRVKRLLCPVYTPRSSTPGAGL